MLNVEKIETSGHKIAGKLTDTFDSAIVGVTSEIEPRLVYSYNIMLDILLKQDNHYQQAERHLREICEYHKHDLVIIYTVEHI